MTQYYKVGRIGSGAVSDPFRPDGVIGMTWGSWQQDDGSFLLWTESQTPPASLTTKPLGKTLEDAEITLGISTPTAS